MRVYGQEAYLSMGVFTPPKTNAKIPLPRTKLMDSARKLIETVFSSLTRGKHLVLGQLNSFWSIRASVCRSASSPLGAILRARQIAAHNLGIWLGL